MVNWSQVARELVSVPERLSTELELMIIRGELPPDQRLPPERELAASLGVSRTSLREALHELELKGLLDRRPGRGTVVTASRPNRFHGEFAAPVDDAEHDFRQVMDLRAVVEPSVAARAAQRATPADVRHLRELYDSSLVELTPSRFFELDAQFHLAVAASARNPLISELLQVVNEWAKSSRRLGLQGASRRRLSLAAHKAILDAIAEGDSVLAQQAMSAHIDAIVEHISEQLHATDQAPVPRS